MPANLTIVKVGNAKGESLMSLFSIVAREDFISIVLDNEASYPSVQPEHTIFREIIPNQSFFLYTGKVEIGEEAWKLAKILAKQGLDLQESALVIKHHWQRHSYSSMMNMEAVIGGISRQKEIQYHIITADEEMSSYYPKSGESLYYANDLSLQLKPMEVLAQKLMMKGMASVSQAQKAQYELFEDFTGVMPGTSSYPRCMVVEKPH